MLSYFWKKSLPVLLLFVLSFQTGGAQVTDKVANSNYQNNNLVLALKQYLKLYEKDSTNNLYNYRIAICYLNLSLDKSKALFYFQKYYNKTSKYYSDDLLNLGIAYFYNKQFDKAVELLQEFLIKEKNNTDLFRYANNYISYSKNAKQFMMSPKDVSFNNLGESVNSIQRDYNPYLNSKNNILIFTSNRMFNSTYQSYVNNIYYSYFNGKTWGKAKSIGNSINTIDDEILTGIAKSDNFILIQLQRYDVFDDIYVCEMNNKKFKNLQPLNDNINTKFIEEGAAISTSEDTLYFASNKPEGFGGFDIYMSFKLPDGTWGPPTNLGNVTNSEKDENYPNISSDGKTLFFASNGYNSMGGYDIFSSTYNVFTKSWSKPVNVGFPINSIYDDKTISFSKDGRYAYKAAIRDDCYGGSDIYQISFNNSKQIYSIFKGIVQIKSKDSTYTVINNKKELNILVYKINSDELFGKYKINPKGNYMISLPPGKFYVNFSDTNYIKNKIVFIVPENNTNSIIIKRNLVYSSF